MLNVVLLYAELGSRAREQTIKGLHLFLETYDALVESLCELIDQDDQHRGASVLNSARDRGAAADRGVSDWERLRAPGIG